LGAGKVVGVKRLDIDETWDADGNLVSSVEVWRDLLPLDSVGALATLLAVTEVVSVQDAANAVGLEPQALIDEAEAWAEFKLIDQA
jgi:hypothetical protein